MPYTVQELYKGGEAARKFTQNIYQSQYDEANAAAAAEKEQLVLQQERVKAANAAQTIQLEQERYAAETAKSRLATNIAETDYKSSKEVQTKYQGWLNTEEGKSADDVQRLQKLAMFETENSRPEQAATLLEKASKVELQQAQAKIKQHDADALQLRSAYSTIDAANDEQMGQLLNNLPKEQRDAIQAKIPGFFEQTDRKLQKAQLKALTSTAQQENTELLNKTRLEMANIQAQWHKYASDILEEIARLKRSGVDASKEAKEEMAAYNGYFRNARSIDFEYKKPIAEAFAAFNKAQEEYKTPNWFGLTTVGSKDARDSAWKNHQALQMEAVDKKLLAAEALPEGKEKTRIIDSLTSAKASIEKKTPPGDEQEKPKPKQEPPGPSTVNTQDVDPKTLLPKPGAPSSKPTQRQYQEGQVYIDANGIKAKYVNGKWVTQ